jgi:hypothetical protein
MHLAKKMHSGYYSGSHCTAFHSSYYSSCHSFSCYSIANKVVFSNPVMCGRYYSGYHRCNINIVKVDYYSSTIVPYFGFGAGGKAPTVGLLFYPSCRRCLQL